MLKIVVGLGAVVSLALLWILFTVVQELQGLNEQIAGLNEKLAVVNVQVADPLQVEVGAPIAIKGCMEASEDSTERPCSAALMVDVSSVPAIQTASVVSVRSLPIATVDVLQMGTIKAQVEIPDGVWVTGSMDVGGSIEVDNSYGGDLNVNVNDWPGLYINGGGLELGGNFNVDIDDWPNFLAVGGDISVANASRDGFKIRD